MTPPELTQLYGLRSHLDALIVAAELQLGMGHGETVPGSCPKCGAAPDLVQDTSTLDGTRRRRCSACAEEWELS